MDIEELLQPLLTGQPMGGITSNDHSDMDSNAEFGGTEARARLESSLLKKVDARMSILILIYILNYIDRNSAAAARLRGFEKDLDLTDFQFATVLSILYVGYILMQIPSNMCLNYIGKPSLYLPGCMAIWGAISISTGFTTNYYGVLWARFFLGFVEAAFFPGALFLISKWYKRNELSQRIAFLSCGALISNAFGSLIASGILSGMEGKSGYAAWRWLFFIEGAITVFVSIFAVFILPDFPETSRVWLTSAEKALAMRRMIEDSGPASTEEGDKQNHFAGLLMTLSDGKVWVLALALTSIVASLSFNSYFPTLCATLGYSPTLTLLLCAPPWFFATVVALLVSRHSDSTNERCRHIVFPLCFGIFGFVLAMSTMNIAVRFLMAQSYAGFICFLAWASGSVSQPPMKRASALALINCVSQFGNIAGSYAWPSSWGPTYKASYSVCIGMSSIGILFCVWFRRHLAQLNSDADKNEAETGTRGYRYTL